MSTTVSPDAVFISSQRPATIPRTTLWNAVRSRIGGSMRCRMRLSTERISPHVHFSFSASTARCARVLPACGMRTPNSARAIHWITLSAYTCGAFDV